MRNRSRHSTSARGARNNEIAPVPKGGGGGGGVVFFENSIMVEKHDNANVMNSRRTSVR